MDNLHLLCNRRGASYMVVSHMSTYEKIMVLVVLVITVALIKVGWFLVDLYYAG